MNSTPATSPKSRRFLVALGLAAVIAIAGTQTPVMAFDGRASCSLWAEMKAALFGVDCHYFMSR